MRWRSKQNVTALVNALFLEALERLPHAREPWQIISNVLGDELPTSLLCVDIQSAGHLDLVLRCMEEEYAALLHAPKQKEMVLAHYFRVLSQMWVGVIYEPLRLLVQREFIRDPEGRAIAEDPRLLRITLEKHEIPSEWKLKESLQLERFLVDKEHVGQYIYNRDDPRRAHVMDCRISERGSIMWKAFDPRANQMRWIERQSLSDRMLKLWGGAAKPKAA